MKKLVMTGGTGFVGREICKQPALEQYETVIITRDANTSRRWTPPGNISLVEGDVFDTGFLDTTLEGCSAVINLVGILNERGHDGSGFDKAHARLPRILAEACIRNHVERFVHMSALNADADKGTSFYLRSKGRGEDAVHALGSDSFHVTSFQPSVIFGSEDSFVNRFDALLRFAPIMPLACPDARFAPVFVGDVANRFVSALEDESSYDQRIALCGPKDYSLLDLVRYIARTAGRRRLIIPLPDFASRMQANVMEYIPGKPFSLDNYRSLQVDSVCGSSTPEATTLESIVPTYL